MENKRVYTVRHILEEHLDEITTDEIWFIWGGEYPWVVPIHKFNCFLESMPAYDLGVIDGQLHIRLYGEEHDHNSPEWQKHLQDIRTWENQKAAYKRYRKRLREEEPERVKEYNRRKSERTSRKRKAVRDQLKRWVDSNIETFIGP